MVNRQGADVITAEGDELRILEARFGDKYRQWNAAFDAGYAAALGTPLITLRDDALTHAMKEVDAAALVTCTDPAQVARTLAYVIRGELAR